MTEAIAADHFETFEFTQDLPFGVLTLVGRDSWFVYGLDPAPHARTGKRTPDQEARRRARSSRRSRGGYRGSFRRGLDLLEGLVYEGKSLSVACDGRPQFVEAHASH
ncbi:MAG TPA: hypothetical protein VMQ62_11490, partial [Dongiaceae bacterium]|nr:hypothetical protein [Dongiaceae bacterium]